MPRYRYKCNECDEIVMVFHSINETHTDCVSCDTKNSMKKMLTTPLKSVKIHKDCKNKSVGSITKEHIEANREILQQEKQKARSETYEPS